ncbi:MAG: F0F1 ATP synthase subunit B [Coriobacteriia bacterium]|nr:F0F1 ATP synthase subunit B [Coriobacteriia bacterium]MCL2537055.1 F0F1 ATP synthase subunit B [Coriobacteriia bacterium]
MKRTLLGLTGLLALTPSLAFAADQAALDAYESATVALKTAQENYDSARAAANVGVDIMQSPIIPTMMEFIPMVITFTILLVLMGKFVWPVVLKALDERAEKIEGSLKKAEEAKIEAEDILNESQEKLSEARRESAGIIEAGKAAGEAARKDTIAKAEEEAADVIARGYANVEAEKVSAFNEVKEDSAKLAVAIAEKILKEKLTPEVDQAMIDAAISDMGGSNG